MREVLNVEAVVTYNYHCAVDVLIACKNKALKRISGSARGVTVYTEEVIQGQSFRVCILRKILGLKEKEVRGRWRK